MRVRVDEEKCCGFAACLSAAPAVFNIDDDQVAVVLMDGDIPEELWAGVRGAADACPTDAILLED